MIGLINGFKIMGSLIVVIIWFIIVVFVVCISKVVKSGIIKLFVKFWINWVIINNWIFGVMVVNIELRLNKILLVIKIVLLLKWLSN